MKSVVKMVHPSGIFTKASRGVTFLASVYQDIFIIWNSFVLQLLGHSWGLVVLFNFWK